MSRQLGTFCIVDTFSISTLEVGDHMFDVVVDVCGCWLCIVEVQYCPLRSGTCGSGLVVPTVTGACG